MKQHHSVVAQVQCNRRSSNQTHTSTPSVRYAWNPQSLSWTALVWIRIGSVIGYSPLTRDPYTVLQQSDLKKSECLVASSAACACMPPATLLTPTMRGKIAICGGATLAFEANKTLIARSVLAVAERSSRRQTGDGYILTARCIRPDRTGLVLTDSWRSAPIRRNLRSRSAFFAAGRREFAPGAAAAAACITSMRYVVR